MGGGGSTGPWCGGSLELQGGVWWTWGGVLEGISMGHGGGRDGLYDGRISVLRLSGSLVDGCGDG